MTNTSSSRASPGSWVHAGHICQRLRLGCWVCRSFGVSRCLMVRKLSVLPSICTNVPQNDSFSIPAFARLVEVEHGWRFRGRTSLWTPDAATYRYGCAVRLRALTLTLGRVIGVLADNSTSRFGRRRPYMLLGSTICVTAMLLLGFTRPFAAIFTGWNNNAVSPPYAQSTVSDDKMSL